MRWPFSPRHSTKLQNYRAALQSYKASLELVQAKTVETAYLDLKARQGFRVTGHTVDADSASPAPACNSPSRF